MIIFKPIITPPRKERKLTMKDVFDVPKNMDKKDKKKKKKKKKQLKTLKEKLKEHAKHHSKKHMDMMRKDIKDGMSFEKAHERALKMVGK